MNRIASRTLSQESAAARLTLALDPAVIDFYMRRGRQERARAFAEMVRGIFSAPAARPRAEVHELPARRRGAAPDACADCADRAA